MMTELPSCMNNSIKCVNVSFDIKISSCTLFSQMNLIILSHICTVPLSEHNVTKLDIYKTLQSYVQTALKYISVDVLQVHESCP